MKQKRIQFPITLSSEAKQAFDNYSKKNPINKSKFIEWIVLQYILKQEQENK